MYTQFFPVLIFALVFKKRLNRRFGTVSYPTDKAFGIWAWTCMPMERAKFKLEAIKHQKGTSLV
jgi:hypothetical protein